MGREPSCCQLPPPPAPPEGAGGRSAPASAYALAGAFGLPAAPLCVRGPRPLPAPRPPHAPPLAAFAPASGAAGVSVWPRPRLGSRGLRGPRGPCGSRRGLFPLPPVRGRASSCRAGVRGGRPGAARPCLWFGPPRAAVRALRSRGGPRWAVRLAAPLGRGGAVPPFGRARPWRLWPPRPFLPALSAVEASERLGRVPFFGAWPSENCPTPRTSPRVRAGAGAVVWSLSSKHLGGVGPCPPIRRGGGCRRPLERPAPRGGGGTWSRSATPQGGGTPRAQRAR